MADVHLDRNALIRTWARAQGFGSEAGLDPVTVVAERSWVRTLGGADPYFALFARGASVEREAIDAALLAGELRISPAVRGCMYLVTADQADLALGLAYHQTHARLGRDLEKAGATSKLMAKTRKAVLKALAEGPATTAELRKGPVAKAITSFGAKGKKVGLSSSLPPALRQLEFEGAIERTPIEGRLDTETYHWSLRERPLERPEVEDANRAIAELFFEHHGPATFEHFVTWSGLGKRAARAALDDLDLVELEADDHEEAQPMLAFETTLAQAKKSRAKPVTLLGLQDLYLVVHGGPGWVCPTDHLEVEIPRWGPMRGGAIRTTQHPHLRAVLVAGELAGFWDVDASMSEQHIAWFDQPGKTLAKRADKQVAALRRFMAEELGHAKTFSIDSDKRIDARFALVRELG